MPKRNPEHLIPFEATAREISRSIGEILLERLKNLPPDSPEFAQTLEEALTHGIHEGIEVGQGLNVPVEEELTQGFIYLKGYYDGFDDGQTTKEDEVNF